jgi:hypothetical protein
MKLRANGMNTVRTIAGWTEGQVDRAKEHFELRYGSAEDGGWDEWIPVALIGPPKARVVNVQFLVEPAEPKDVEAVSAVKKQIQFYLIDKAEPNPWSYAKYHCGTDSNVYSHVHWSFFKVGSDSGEIAGG